MTFYTWTASKGGKWTTAADWDPSGPPTAGSNVHIDGTNGGVITYNTTVSIDSLGVFSPFTLQMTGGALTVVSDITTIGPFGSFNLAISGAARLTVDASDAAVSGTFADSG